MGVKAMEWKGCYMEEEEFYKGRGMGDNGVIR
jgi:hypothetical protein